MTARKSTSTAIGNLGEQVVARWLIGQGWKIQARQWRSRWGEIDLIAWEPATATLAFVEVKTRAPRNWDAGGLLAIAPAKQAKLWRTAELFLATFDQPPAGACRFDLALVRYRPTLRARSRGELPAVEIGQPLDWAGYEFVLDRYIAAAFSQ